MNTTAKVLVVDNDPKLRTEIAIALRNGGYEILNASNYDEALQLIATKTVSRIILGSNAAAADTQLFVKRISEETTIRKTAICHLTDSEKAITQFPKAASAFTQFAISRKSEIHKLKESFEAIDLNDYAQAPKVEHLVGEMFDTLKEYSTEMSDSIRYASQIQKAVLPGESSLSRLAESFVLNYPRNIVSGDFFWFTVRFNRVIIAVADCTGHGVPGALLSIIGHNTLNSIVNEKNITDPKDIIKQLNYRFQRIFENHDGITPAIRDGMDIAVISIDTTNRVLDFAGARRPLNGIVNGEAIKIKGDLHAVGVHTPLSAEFTQHRIAYGPQDVFYLSSDGFSDQFGGLFNKKIGSRQFEKILADHSSAPLIEQKQLLDSFLQEWKQQNLQTDDILVLGIKPGTLI